MTVRPLASSVSVPYSLYMPSTACWMPRPAMAMAASGTMKPQPFVALAPEALDTFAEQRIDLQPYLRPSEPAMSSPWMAALFVFASSRSP